MSLGQIADLAYVVLADRVETRAASDRVTTGVARALGSTVDQADPDEWRARLDEMLTAEPKVLTAEERGRQAVLRELGLGG